MYRKMSGITAMTGTLLLTASLGAQQRPDSTGAHLPAVLVTATRVDSVFQGRVSASTVLPAEELQRRGITNLADALRFVPGAHIVQSGSPGSETAIFMRGGERDFVLVLLDGVPLNEPGGFINIANISLDNIDRIEVVRGPVSVLYGSDAVTGVIQIFTRKSEAGRRAEAAVTVGSRGTRDTQLSQAATGSAGSYSIGAARYRTDGIHDLNNRYRSDSYSGQLSLGLGRNMDARATGRFTDARYAYPTKFYGEPIDSNSFNAEKRLSTGLDVTSRLGRSTDAIIDIGYVKQNTTFADPADATTPFPFESRNQLERRTAGARVNFRGLTGAVLSGGLEYEIQRSATEGAESPALNPLLDRWSRSAFAQLLATSEEDFDLAVGTRFDDNERFGVFNTWRVAMGFPIDSVTRFRGALGTAFREPQFLQLTGGGFAKPNPALEPERTRSWELALEYSVPSLRALLSATYFRQRFSDLIVFASLQDDPEFFSQYQNADRARASGWELEVRAEPAPAVSLSANYTLLKTRLGGGGPESGRPLPRRPTGYGSASVNLRPGQRLSFGGDVQYVGRRSDTRFFESQPGRTERLGGYAKVDLSARLNLAQNPATASPMFVTLRVDNALDRRYEAVAGFETPRRRYFVGASMVLAY